MIRLVRKSKHIRKNVEKIKLKLENKGETKEMEQNYKEEGNDSNGL